MAMAFCLLTILAKNALIAMYIFMWLLILCDTKVEAELSFVGYSHFARRD